MPKENLVNMATHLNVLKLIEFHEITGLLTTTARKLDRENQPEHILEVKCFSIGIAHARPLERF